MAIEYETLLHIYVHVYQPLNLGHSPDLLDMRVVTDEH